MLNSLSLKRLMDILGSVIGILFGFPLFLAAAIAVKIESEGPVLYIQKRVGKNGKVFDFFKIRSMINGADLMPHDPHNKIRADPRITRVGRFLRSTSIDELPQLVNVLLGQMSLVGPRSFTPSDTYKFPESYRQKVLRFKPGITGLCQIKGRSLNNLEQRILLDLEYTDKWSLVLDIKILIKTIYVVITKEGAF